MLRQILITIGVLLLLAGETQALGPHELLVLANRQSPRSLELARSYMALRHVPAINLVELDLPPDLLEMPPDEFTRRVLSPALTAAKQRKLAGHILAWAYSLDFPIRIATDPPLSLQGFTFLRGHLPDRDAIRNGSYASPFFAGPDNPRFQGFPSQALDVQSAWMNADMPLPSMMLGFAGPHGNTTAEITAALERGRQADGTRPNGTIYFVTNTDIRSTCRQWEFEPAVAELRAAGISACITNALPSLQTNVLGILCGMADVAITSPVGFLPGAMADHLTSFGAAFDTPAQTKISAWLRAGATATAGTVTEPLSNWTKFPHARYFAHLAAGCSTLEAFFQSLRCPLQTLLLGDPLASPWSSSASITFRGLESGLQQDHQQVTITIQAPAGESFSQFLYLLDGVPLGPKTRNTTLTLNRASIPPGHHLLRAIAYRTGSARPQIFTEIDVAAKP
jgi:uncharacterized protein (TIGR03790 family)